MCFAAAIKVGPRFANQLETANPAGTYAYAYDSHTSSSTGRSIGYDGLDRMTSATGPAGAAATDFSHAGPRSYGSRTRTGGPAARFVRTR